MEIFNLVDGGEDEQGRTESFQRGKKNGRCSSKGIWRSVLAFLGIVIPWSSSFEIANYSLQDESRGTNCFGTCSCQFGSYSSYLKVFWFGHQLYQQGSPQLTTIIGYSSGLDSSFSYLSLVPQYCCWFPLSMVEGKKKRWRTVNGRQWQYPLVSCLHVGQL